MALEQLQLKPLSLIQALTHNVFLLARERAESKKCPTYTHMYSMIIGTTNDSNAYMKFIQIRDYSAQTRHMRGNNAQAHRNSITVWPHKLLPKKMIDIRTKVYCTSFMQRQR